MAVPMDQTSLEIMADAQLVPDEDRVLDSDGRLVEFTMRKYDGATCRCFGPLAEPRHDEMAHFVAGSFSVRAEGCPAC